MNTKIYVGYPQLATQWRDQQEAKGFTVRVEIRGDYIFLAATREQGNRV